MKLDNHTYTASLPKKRMASGALIKNEQNEILLVNPVYRDKWLIPGGTVEENESPKDACEREIKEELGLTISVGSLLALDYMPESEEGTEALHFIFDGGVLNDDDIKRIALEKSELSEYRFLPEYELKSYLPNALLTRLTASLRISSSITSLYLEIGV